MIHLVAMAGLVCVMVVPRAISGLRGLALMALAVGGVAAAGWFGWAAHLPVAADRGLVVLVAAPVLAALAAGLVVRGIVVGRRWPMLPDVVLTVGTAGLLILNYLRLFDLI